MTLRSKRNMGKRWGVVGLTNMNMVADYHYHKKAVTVMAELMMKGYLSNCAVMQVQEYWELRKSRKHPRHGERTAVEGERRDP